MSAGQDPSSAAEQARESLREEIGRLREDVERMAVGAPPPGGGGGEATPGRVDRLEERLLRLEGRIDQVEQERHYAEWRMYTNVERLLDDTLRELRSIADRLSR